MAEVAPPPVPLRGSVWVSTVYVVGIGTSLDIGARTYHGCLRPPVGIFFFIFN